MPTFSEFKELFPAFPESESIKENKQKITLGISAIFIIGLVIYLVIKNRGR